MFFFRRRKRTKKSLGHLRLCPRPRNALKVEKRLCQWSSRRTSAGLRYIVLTAYLASVGADALVRPQTLRNDVSPRHPERSAKRAVVRISRERIRTQVIGTTQNARASGHNKAHIARKGAPTAGGWGIVMLLYELQLLQNNPTVARVALFPLATTPQLATQLLRRFG